MELGALVCAPATPDCGVCPLAFACAARRHGRQHDFPVRAAKKDVPVRHAKAVVVTDGQGRVLLVQNHEGGLLKGLWELPEVEESTSLVQGFSHFRLELQSFAALRHDAEFRDPREVPLTTATRKILDATAKSAPRKDNAYRLTR